MRAQILPPTPENIELAAGALRRLEVIGMPTETVYGLAGSALAPEALARIFETKERPTFDPLIIHVGVTLKGLYPLEQAQLVSAPPSKFSDRARTRADALMQAFWPGPLTLILPKHERVPELATSGLPTVAVRMPAHRVAQWLLAASGLPLAAPSANRFGRISPTSAPAVAEELGDRIDWILDGGPCEIGVESTVIGIDEDGTLRLLRPGGLSRARIEEALGCLVETTPAGAGAAPTAPGMLDSHYAPRKPLWLLPSDPEWPWERIVHAGPETPAPNFGFLLLGCADIEAFRSRTRARLHAHGCPGADVTVVALSRDGEIAEVARNLFAGLRELDASAAGVLFAEPCALDRGLGHAVADRLTRASRGKI